ncbi:MAG: hypothetical protein OEY52_11840 [Gammaproteobacteria bacterium]|nr:hypothetical protein [Gammaproteobacteria bacterium]
MYHLSEVSNICRGFTVFKSVCHGCRVLALVFILALASCLGSGNGGSPGTGSGTGVIPCNTPKAPQAQSAYYLHSQFTNMPLPEGGGTDSTITTSTILGNPLAISENGARVSLLLNINTYPDLFRSLSVFAPDKTEPVFNYTTTVPFDSGLVDSSFMMHQAMSRDGRSLAVFLGDKLMYFECDQAEPKWEWDGREELYGAEGADARGDQRIHQGGPLSFSADGNFLLTIMRRIDETQLYKQNVLLFKRDENKPVVHITVDSRNQGIKAAVSSDGSRIAVITSLENPDDIERTQMEVLDEWTYRHSRVILFENGKLQWTKWLMHKCNKCDDDVIALVKPTFDIAISENGEIITAAGPGGQIVRYQATGGIELSHFEGTSPDGPDRNVPWKYKEFKVSDNGKRISSTVTKWDFVTRGMMYFDMDKGNGPIWQSHEIRETHVSYPGDDDPQPHTYPVLFEEGYLGFDYHIPFSWPSKYISPDLKYLEMSYDGNLMLARKYFFDGVTSGHEHDGHLYAFYHGAPIPFQVLTENAQPANDSDLILGALSGDGRWAAGLAYEIDNDIGEPGNILQPAYRLHLYEIPPGSVLEIPTDLTVRVNGDTGEVIGLFGDTDLAKIVRHVVKPGRAATLREELRLTTLLGQLLFDDCIPWHSNKTFDYSWPDGFKANVEVMDWQTPDCLSNQTQPTMMLLRQELFSGDVLSKQLYKDYFHIEIYTNE